MAAWSEDVLYGDAFPGHKSSSLGTSCFPGVPAPGTSYPDTNPLQGKIPPEVQIALLQQKLPFHGTSCSPLSQVALPRHKHLYWAQVALLWSKLPSPGTSGPLWAHILISIYKWPSLITSGSLRPQVPSPSPSQIPQAKTLSLGTSCFLQAQVLFSRHSHKGQVPLESKVALSQHKLPSLGINASSQLQVSFLGTSCSPWVQVTLSGHKPLLHAQVAFPGHKLLPGAQVPLQAQVTWQIQVTLCEQVALQARVALQAEMSL